MSSLLNEPIVIYVSENGTTGPRGETGNGIESLSILSEAGLVKTYRILFTDGDYFDFEVSDGNGIAAIAKTGTVGLVDTYTITFTNGTTTTFTVTNGEKGDKGDKGDTGNGISSIAKTGTVGLVDTYQIAFTDGTVTTFNVTNGNGILSVEKTGTVGLADTYTITFTNGTTNTYVVTNGKGITVIEKTATAGLTDTYTITYNDGTTSTFTVSNGNGIASVAKTGTAGLVDTYTITFTDGTSTTFEVTNGSDEWGQITGTLSDQTDLQNALDDKAPAITETASGAMVTIEDATTAPVKALTVGIEPVQEGSGDPSPDNVRPISGHAQSVVTRTGKNLWKLSDSSLGNNQRVNITYTSDGATVSCTGTYARYQWVFDTIIGKTYTISFDYLADGGYKRISGRNYWNNDWNDIAHSYFDINNEITDNIPYHVSQTFTATTDKFYICVYATTSQSSATNTITNFQLELGSTATSYEPYQGQTISVTFPSEAGTVYGGTLDVTNRVLTVTHALHSVSIDDSTALAQYNVSPYAGRIGIVLQDGHLVDITGGFPSSAIKCSTAKYNAGITGQLYKPGWCMLYNWNNAGEYIPVALISFPLEYDTKSKALEYLHSIGCTIYYPLAVPLTYTLTPQQMTLLLGQNHIWADTGDVSIEYRADTKLYIDNAIAKSQTATRSLITGIEASMTATQNYTTGALIIVGDDLYKATANIASGGTLTVGTNVSKITLAQYILEQLSA